MKEQEIQFAKAYSILSDAGFELIIEDGQLIVHLPYGEIGFDDEGYVTIIS
jgi:hypothetical protein